MCSTERPVSLKKGIHGGLTRVELDHDVRGGSPHII